MNELKYVLNGVTDALSEISAQVKDKEKEVVKFQKVTDRVVLKLQKAVEKLQSFKTQMSAKKLTVAQNTRLLKMQSEVSVLTDGKKSSKSDLRIAKIQLVELKRKLRVVRKINSTSLKIIEDEQKKLDEITAKKMGIPPKKRGRKKKVTMVWVPVVPS
ncbi:MAG: hypothetical protein KZQ74_05260 [gamma proteobacterium symbiont of Bathyaustriella thionipta]|nr:hypothetical protein [gamma proteobacterium symbiont of Bathyaustriella thionipta]MCU7957767.1 hypothetical protein [gamma proteobacterium symbiont of Bathyaustriella thionipta]MCU7966595.1 hypothetical protein [gamma proteobacterium symbiont of Bathyaustriella thionipta]